MVVRSGVRRGIALAAVALLVGVTVTSAQAQGDGASSGDARVAASAADAPRGPAAARADVDYGIPPISADPNVAVPYGGSFDVLTNVKRAKITVSLPDQHTLTHAKVCVAIVIGSGLPNIETCCPDETASTCFKVNPPPTSADDSGIVSWSAITGPTWVESPRNVSPTHGIFAPVQVSALAFGSIPVTATVRLSQPFGSNGYARPFLLDYRLENTGLGAGVTSPGYEPSPVSVNGNFLYLPASITGVVEVGVSDVRVDGVPVEVGPNCRTRTPAALRLGTPGGWAEGSDKPEDLVGRPGEFQTLPNSQMQGVVDIPPFAGCGRGREDLDPLLTALVSGPRNPASVKSLTTLDQCDQQCAPYPIEAAPTGGATGQRAPRAAADTDVPVNKRLAALSAGQRAKVVANIAKAPADVRAVVLKALPQLRSAVKAAR